MRIKLFEQFDQSILDEVDMCLVDLRDKGFNWNYGLNDGRFNLCISLYKYNTKAFKADDIKESIEIMIEYFDDKYGVEEYSLTKPDSPGPGLKVKLYDTQNLYYVNIKINLKN